MENEVKQSVKDALCAALKCKESDLEERMHGYFKIPEDRSKNMEKSCDRCKYCLQQDYGWSNWTVEGTNTSCLLGLNPKFPDDRWYGKAESLKFAEKCEKFYAGEPVEVDCDMEHGDLVNYSDDPEIKALLANVKD